MKWVYRTLAAVVILAGSVVAFAYGTALRGERPVGFQMSRAADAGGNSFPVGVWYPTESRPWPTAQIGTVLMDVARDAPIAGRGLPLVVMSHGNGGGLQSHADLALALASAGYVVAAPMHTGDNFLDQSAAGSVNLFSVRNRQFRATIDHILTEWQGNGSVDPGKVGAFGFSAGGFTVLTAIGAQPDMRLVAVHCARAPEFECDVLRHSKSPLVVLDAPTGDPMEASPGIKAAVAAAPGLGFTMSPAALAAVQVPVQLWSGDKDDKVPFATNAAIIAEALGQKAELHQVPGANHASFLVPCGLMRPPDICTDPEGFDRKAFHASMNAEVVKFFDKALKH